MPFRIAKRHVLEPETARFAVRNGSFCNAKRQTLIFDMCKGFVPTAFWLMSVVWFSLLGKRLLPLFPWLAFFSSGGN